METPAVQSLFNAIAPRYDLLNHLLSAGVDLRWRSRAIETLRNLRPAQVLDVACGTADLSIAAADLHPESIIGVDVAERMLQLGQAKIDRKGLSNLIHLETGRAESLRFSDETFDAAIVSFGVRNFEDLRKGLGEMFRVLRPGGMIVVLEFSRPDHVPIQSLYFFYFRHLLPKIGNALSNHPDAYQYLHDTVMQFPEGVAFLDELRKAGFDDLTEERLTFGIATIYTGTRPPP